MLTTMGIIERKRRRGDRKDYFRNKSDAWLKATEQQIGQFTYLRQLLEKGLALVDSSKPEVTEGLRDMRDMLAFYERELPEIFARWEAKNREE